MTSKDRYFIGPGLRDKLRDMVRAHDSSAIGGGATRIPTRLQDMRSPPGMRLIRGTCTGSWAIAATKSVTVIGSTNTFSVTNYCVPITKVAGDTASYNVIFGAVGGTVTAVEIQTGQATRLGKTTSAWSKGSLATIQIYEKGTPPNEVVNDGPETLADCVNKFADVQSGKWVMVTRAGNGRYYLIAAEC